MILVFIAAKSNLKSSYYLAVESPKNLLEHSSNDWRNLLSGDFVVQDNIIKHYNGFELLH